MEAPPESLSFASITAVRINHHNWPAVISYDVFVQKLTEIATHSLVLFLFIFVLIVDVFFSICC